MQLDRAYGNFPSRLTTSMLACVLLFATASLSAETLEEKLLQEMATPQVGVASAPTEGTDALKRVQQAIPTAIAQLKSRDAQLNTMLVGAAGTQSEKTEADIRKEVFREAVKVIAGTKVPRIEDLTPSLRVGAGASPSEPLEKWPLADPTKFSWKERGFVTDVRDQGNCGSCWDFTAVAAAEANRHIRLKKTAGPKTDMSEQYILNGGFGGTCAGGFYLPVWKTVMKSPGTADEDAVPYTAKVKQNPNVPTPYRVIDSGLVASNYRATNTQLKQALVERGPLAITVEADERFVSHRGSGVFKGFPSDYQDINHAILLVGWDDSKKAWLIKNSWNATWGDQGYGWIQYDTNNVGYAAAWVQSDTAGEQGGSDTPDSTKEHALLNDSDPVSTEIWKNLAVYQAQQHTKSDPKDDKKRPLLDLSVATLKAKTTKDGVPTIRAENQALRKTLRDEKAMTKQWDAVLKK